MPDTFASPFSQQQNAGGQGIEERLQILEADMKRRQAVNVSFGSLDEAANDLGVYQVGELIAGTGTPEGGDLSGVVIAYPGIIVAGVVYNILGMNNGNFEFGISAVDGTAVFAGGAGILSANGLIMTGLFYPVQFTATNAGNTRTGRFGMTLLPASSIPVMQWDYESPAGATTVSNGTFATGDLTNWTDSGSAWTVILGMDGVYYTEHTFGAAAWPAELTQVVTGITPSVYYNLSFDSKRVAGYLNPKMYLEWRDSGHSILRTDVFVGNPGSAWVNVLQGLTTPANTAEVNIRINAGGDPFQQSGFRNISLAASGNVTQLSATDDGLQVEGTTPSMKFLDMAANPLTNPDTGYTRLFSRSSRFWANKPSGICAPIDGKIYANNTDVALTSNSAEQTIANIAFPGGLLGTNGLIHISGWIDILNNSGAPRGVIFTFYYGTASAVAANGTLNASASWGRMIFDLYVRADGATNAQIFYGGFRYAGQQVAFGNESVTAMGTNKADTGAIDSTVDQTVKLTWTSAVTNANYKIAARNIMIEFIPTLP